MKLHISNKEYRSLDAVSRSDLMELRKSPKHFRFKSDSNIADDSKALIFGSLVHKLVLEPDTFDDEFAIAPNVDRRTKAGKDEYERFIQTVGDKMIVSLDDFHTASVMAKVVESHPEASRLLYEGKPEYETSYTWLDSETGIVCKIRPDCVNELDGQTYIIDYKTTDSCDYRSFYHSCKKYGYQLQTGMYISGMFEQDYSDYKFIFIAQEKAEPYAVRIFKCDDSFTEFGIDEFRELLNTLRICQDNNDWHGYEEATLTEGGD